MEGKASLECEELLLYSFQARCSSPLAAFMHHTSPPHGTCDSLLHHPQLTWSYRERLRAESESPYDEDVGVSRSLPCPGPHSLTRLLADAYSRVTIDTCESIDCTTLSPYPSAELDVPSMMSFDSQLVERKKERGESEAVRQSEAVSRAAPFVGAVGPHSGAELETPRPSQAKTPPRETTFHHRIITAGAIVSTGRKPSRGEDQG